MNALFHDDFGSVFLVSINPGSGFPKGRDVIDMIEVLMG